jgi:hypothetical protein
MKAISLLLPACLACLACSSEADPGPQPFLEPPAPEEGFQVGMTVTAPAGEEIWKCLVMDALPTEERFVWINRAVHKQSDFVHHMDLMALAFTGLDLEPGLHDCDDIYAGAQGETLMDDGIVLYASQQAEATVQLPPGVVAEVPAQTPFMLEVHYVNTSEQDVEVHSYVNGYTIPPEQVVSTIWGGAVRDRNLNVPPNADAHVEWSRCTMTEDVDVVFLSSHTHELATNFQIRPFDGQTVGGELLYENRDWQSPFLRHFDPPLHVPAGQGFEFQCHYRSTRDTVTNWGYHAEDEMCQIAVVFTPGRSSIACEVVETSDGVIMP